VDESETGSANFFARNLAALARGFKFGQREGGGLRSPMGAETGKARIRRGLSSQMHGNQRYVKLERK
jgi:hypothetical protein